MKCRLCDSELMKGLICTHCGFNNGERQNPQKNS